MTNILRAIILSAGNFVHSFIITANVLSSCSLDGCAYLINFVVPSVLGVNGGVVRYLGHRVATLDVNWVPVGAFVLALPFLTAVLCLQNKLGKWLMPSIFG